MNKVILIDDEPLARAVIENYLKAYPNFEIVAHCENGFEGVKAIEQHQPDLLFLDIQMPKINGFEMLELLENPPSVIFTTAFDEYALKAFETAAVDYLLKPFSKARFQQAIERWTPRDKSEKAPLLAETIHKQPDEHQRIVIKEGATIKIIPTNNVTCIEAYGDYVKIFANGEKYLKKKTLSYFEKSLDPSEFIRVHRSYILNINALTGIEPFEKNTYRAILTDKQRIPISRSAYAPLKSLLGV